MEFTLTKNANADQKWFEYWLKKNYENYDGLSEREGESFITIHITSFTQAERDAITAYYASLDGSETIDDVTCQIYDYISWNGTYDTCCPPMEVDYKRMLDVRLHPVITNVFKGEVREITFYESVTVDPTTGVQTGVNPVVKEEYVYTRNADKIAQSRVMTITWFLKDGTEHPDTKVRNKVYTNEQAISEGVTRRTNIIDFMQIPLLGQLMATVPCTYADAVDQGGLFFEKYVVEVETYKFSPRQQTLQNAIAADTEFAWLDNDIGGGFTIRDYIIDQLNY